MLKRFFYASAAILMLALAYHLGAGTATAQAPSNPVVAALAPGIVVTANGDVYANPNLINPSNATPWQLAGHVFGGGPIPAQQESWGTLKTRYR